MREGADLDSRDDHTSRRGSCSLSSLRGEEMSAVSDADGDFAFVAAYRAGRTLTNLCHAASVAGGWWQDLKTGEPLERNVGELLMLIVSEIAEGMEGHRKNKMDDKLPHRPMLEVEMADAVIRIADLCGGLDLDLGGAIAEKLAFNAVRPDHKLEARMADDGKKY